MQGCSTVQAETQHWTALTYAALVGNATIAKLLLDRGAHVEGGARLSEERCTITPLQVLLLIKTFIVINIPGFIFKLVLVKHTYFLEKESTICHLLWIPEIQF